MSPKVPVRVLAPGAPVPEGWLTVRPRAISGHDHVGASCPACAAAMDPRALLAGLLDLPTSPTGVAVLAGTVADRDTFEAALVGPARAWRDHLVARRFILERDQLRGSSRTPSASSPDQ